MTILHYIPSMALSAGYMPEYVSRIVVATQRVATSHILKESDLGSNIFSFRSELRKQLQLLSPDIVHIHAAWNFKAAFVAQTARSMGYFVVVSPHGLLSPTNMETNFWKEKLPRIFTYQLRMIKHCNAVVVTSDKELKDMVRLHWKRNIALVPNPHTSTISDEELCQTIIATYHKVIDTNYRSRITPEEETLIHTMLKAHAWPADSIMPIDATQIEISGLSFRRMYFMVHDHGVMEQFIDGAHRLGIAIPPKPDVDSIPRFWLRIKPGRIEKRHTRTLILILHKLTGDQTIFNVEQLDLKALLHIYCKIRFCDFDEDQFATLAKRHGVYFFTKKVLARMQEMFQLELGYMPILPKK